MGFHICKHCHNQDDPNQRFSNHSSGDVNLTFTNGHRWVMPDMILHYVADHSYQPPQKFIADVMTGELAKVGRVQTRSVSAGITQVATVMDGTKVGYLSDEFDSGEVPEGFIEKLEQLMAQAGSQGMRVQTKGIQEMNGRGNYD